MRHATSVADWRVANNVTPDREQKITEKPLGLLDLPYDIKFIIYQLCFVRPIGIVPAAIDTAVDFVVMKRVSLATAKSSANTRSTDTNGRDVSRSYPNRARTAFQVAMVPPESLRSGRLISQFLFNKVASPSMEPVLNPWLWNSSDRRQHCLDRKTIHISGFIGIRLLRTCKRVHDEGSEVLYGHNNFLFFTDDIHWYGSIQYDADELPSAPLAHCVLPDEDQISQSIKNLFSKKFRHCRSVWYDPLLRFFVAIGPRNAAPLKSIDITGTFQVANPAYHQLSFASILPIYTTIMSRVCRRLTKITLHKIPSDDTWGYDFDEFDENGNKIEGIERKTDDERISDAVEKLAKGLPQVKQLQLGGNDNGNEHGINIESASGLYVDEGWGNAMKWIQCVNDRASGSETSNANAAISEENKDAERSSGPKNSSVQETEKMENN
ncbi:hypothetical protein BKA64DRAFT_776669 [Cadophora sp. MPI-SDFR-AT-0126]|nr:hypothetical protein BKA64DRAFT_776669 [Leotiomycetes sp. MPI-SDFR-AT-0126]